MTRWSLSDELAICMILSMNNHIESGITIKKAASLTLVDPLHLICREGLYHPARCGLQLLFQIHFLQ